MAALRETLLAGSRTRSPATGFPVFAFRLHQFFSGGNPVAVSLDPPATREITTSGQAHVPGSGRERVFLPLAFCRECGQDYFPVHLVSTEAGDVFEPREISDRLGTERRRAGYLYVSDEHPWPESSRRSARPGNPPPFQVRHDHRSDLPQRLSGGEASPS